MYPLIECARARCSEGEMIEALQEVFGSYSESPVFYEVRAEVLRAASISGYLGRKCNGAG